MAHPYAHAKSVRAGPRRAKQILSSGGCAMPHKASGGSVGKVTTGKAAKAEMRRMVHQSEKGEGTLTFEGNKPKHRARGGKVKHQTNIAIVIPHHKSALGAQDAAGAMAGPPPGMGPLPPPGAMPGQPMPMRARGGRLGVGEDPPEDISEGWQTSRKRKARPGAREVSIDCLPGSALPETLKKIGYRLRRGEDGTRILPFAVTESFVQNADGALAASEGSTRPVTMVTHSAGIAPVERYSFEIP